MGNGRSSYIIGEIPQKIHKVTPDRKTPRVHIRNFFLSMQWSVMRYEMKLDNGPTTHKGGIFARPMLEYHGINLYRAHLSRFITCFPHLILNLEILRQ